MQSNALNTTITLSGDEEVKKAFQEILAVGQKALNDLSAHAKQAGAGIEPLQKSMQAASEHGERMSAAFESLSAVFGQLPGALGEVIEPLTTLSELFTTLTTGMTGVTLAGAALVAALYTVADSAAKATNATNDAAKAAGLSREEFEGLRYAAAQTGVNSEDAARGIERFAVKMAEARGAAETARKSYEDSVPTLDQMAQGQRAAQNAAEAAATAIRQSANSVTVAQHAFEASGRALKATKDSLAELRGEYANQLQAGRGDPALAKRIDDAQQAVADREFELQQAAIRQREAAEAARMAQLKARQDAEDRLEKQQEKAAESAKKRDQDATSANDKRLQSIATAFTAGGLANTYKAFGELSDQFKALTNNVERASLAQSVFGKQWPQFVGLLDQGSAKLREVGEELEHLKISETDAETAAATAWQTAISKLTLVLEGARNAFGNIVGQLFTPGFEALAHSIAEHMTEIRAVAQGLVNFLTPVFRAVGTVLGAVVASLDWIGQTLSKATGTQISGTLTVIGVALAVLVPQIAALGFALALLHEKIREVFGQGWADALLPFVAAVAVVIKAITALRTALIGLWAASSPILLIVAAIAAVGAAIYLVYGDVDGLSALIGKVFGEDARKAFDNFVRDFREVVQTASEWFKNTFLGRMVSLTIDSVHNMIVTFTSFVALLGALWDAAAESYKNGWLGSFVSGTVAAVKYVYGWFVWLTDKIAEVFIGIDRLLGIGRKGEGGGSTDYGGGGGGGGSTSTTGGGGNTTMFNLGTDLAVSDGTATVSSSGEGLGTGGGGTLAGYGASSGITYNEPARGSSGGVYSGGGTPRREVHYLARGGQVHGAGGVDNVPIRATAGEFVTRVAAVRHYGTAFMHRINNMQVPRGFAMGGLVGGFEDMLRGPRGYAGGGAVSPGTGDGPAVAVQLSHGGDTFRVMAPASVADRLVTHSRREQMRSGGRKPDWFGGS